MLADTPPIGYVIAEGDLWFAYPGLDVLGALKGRTLPGRDYYKVYSAASPGDTVESMAYDSDQLEGFADEFRKVLDAENRIRSKRSSFPAAAMTWPERFHVLLNHQRASSISALDSAVADAFIDRIGRSLESLIGTSARYASQILGLLNVRIIIHGYAPPVPDGRPFGIGWPLPGPWLQPGFTAKGYPNATISELVRNTRVMADLINRFNKRVSAIPANLRGRADVRYVDLTAALRIPFLSINLTGRMSSIRPMPRSRALRRRSTVRFNSLSRPLTAARIEILPLLPSHQAGQPPSRRAEVTRQHIAENSCDDGRNQHGS